MFVGLTILFLLLWLHAVNDNRRLRQILDEPIHTERVARALERINRAILG